MVEGVDSYEEATRDTKSYIFETPEKKGWGLENEIWGIYSQNRPPSTCNMERRRPKYHAHVDCFSGAAGDMLLAACLDAADSLPAPLLGISADADGDKNSDKFLTQLVHDLEGGLPELKGEFELSVKRVWRGVGRIAAKKVDVHSVYNHDAAPVPGARVNVEEVGGEVHSHEHTHEEEGKMHSHEHEHHTHNHCHNQEEQEESGVEVGDTTDEGLKRDPHGDSHSHSHGHSHSHNHSHSHSHSHSHQSVSALMLEQCLYPS